MVVGIKQLMNHCLGGQSMKKLLSFCIIMFFIVNGIVFAGVTGKISGTIKDANTGEPLPGANVVLVGTTQGAATDLDGNY